MRPRSIPATARAGVEPLYSIREVAERLNVHYETVRRWIEKGALEAVRIGPNGTIRVPESALRESVITYSSGAR